MPHKIPLHIATRNQTFRLQRVFNFKYESMKKGVCSKIKQLRLEKGFSQDYMATRLGISRSQYANIENQQHELTISNLVQLSEIFNINPTHFFEEIVYDHYIKGGFQSEPFQKSIEIKHNR